MAEQELPFASIVGFAKSDDDAKGRYEQWRTKDPFPDDIPPALLNSGDIADYVAATGMMHPFDPIPPKLKPASYEVDLLGKCVAFVGPKRADIEVSQIETGQLFVLRENEIAFVQLEPMFRLPEYIALRFNLRIKHVYRGLLLGTGPLVDPGFVGRLWIPLHNLTSNEYVLRGGEGLVWMEFTKLSPRVVESLRDVRQTHFTSFPKQKIERMDIIDYLDHAAENRSIRSSIPVLLEKTAAAAKDSATSADEAERAVRRVGLFVTIGGAIGLLAILISVFMLITAVRDRAEEALRKSDLIEQKLDVLEERLQSTMRNAIPGT